jgi:hypothetical protein
MKQLIKTFEGFNFDDFVAGQDEPQLEIDHDDHKAENYMFFGNIETIHRLTGIILEMDPNKVDSILKDGHNWAVDHIATSKDDVEEVANFLINEFGEDSMGHDEQDHQMTMSEGYTCNECGTMYEEAECNEDMMCECGGNIQ